MWCNYSAAHSLAMQHNIHYPYSSRRADELCWENSTGQYNNTMGVKMLQIHDKRAFLFHMRAQMTLCTCDVSSTNSSFPSCLVLLRERGKLIQNFPSVMPWWLETFNWECELWKLRILSWVHSHLSPIYILTQQHTTTCCSFCVPDEMWKIERRRMASIMRIESHVMKRISRRYYYASFRKTRLAGKPHFAYGLLARLCTKTLHSTHKPVINFLNNPIFFTFSKMVFVCINYVIVLLCFMVILIYASFVWY